MKHTIRVFDGDTGAERYAITSVIDCTYQDRLDGAPTLRFTILYEPEFETDVNCNLHFDDERFRVKQTSKRMANGLQFLEVYAEHQSIALVDRKINRFDPRGTAQTALNEALDGTGITGTVDSSLLNVSLLYNMLDTNTRTVLLGIATAVKGELAYSGNSINIVPHRGSTVVRAFPDPSVGVVDVSVAEDGDTFSCTATLPGSATYGVGDEVSVYFGGLGVSQNKRVVGIRYNPFLDTTKTYEVGDYTPTIVEFYKKTMDTANKAKNDASSALNRANNVAKDVSENYVKKYEMNASVDTYINSEEGKASIVASLSGKYVTPEEVEGFVEEKELNAEIGAYLDMEEGTAKIIAATEGTYAKKTDLNNYVESTQLNTEISQYLNTTTGQAAITSAVSGTYAKKTDLNNYVESTQLNTEISQYLNTTTGQAAITSAVSGTYAKKTDLSGYATVTALNTVKQSVSDVSSEIELSTSYSKNTIGTNVQALLLLVSNANSSKIKLKADMIEFTGTSKFLTASDLGSSGTTSIDGGRIKTGTISADRIEAKFLTASDLGSSGTTSIDGGRIKTGTISADRIEAKFLTASDLGSSGTTSIDGGRIKTGKISADRIEAITVKTDTVYGTGTFSDTIMLTSSVNNVYVGGTGAFINTANNTYIMAVKKILIGESTTNGIEYNCYEDALIPSGSGTISLGTSSNPWKRAYLGNSSSEHWVVSFSGIIPSSSSDTSSAMNIGSSNYPVRDFYVRRIHTVGEENMYFNNGNVYMGGTSSYYIVCDYNCALRPNYTTTSWPSRLGTIDYYWQYAYIGSTATYIGTTSSSKLGFFGTTPVAKQSLSSNASTSDIVSALKRYGLFL